MKKILMGLSLCLALSVVGLTATSCDEDTLAALLGGLFNQGETYTFTGTETVTVLTGKNASDEYEQTLASDATLSSKTVTFKASQTAAGVEGELTLPAISSTGGQVSLDISQAFVGGVVCTNNGTNSMLALPETGYRADGTITIDGTSSQISGVYIAPSSYVNTTSIYLQLTLYYGANSEHAVNVVYTGQGAREVRS